MAAEVERARRFEQPLGLIMLDIDDFKQVNDTYGHQQGDLVLREVARVLRETSREIDEPARYGGEELAVALPQTDLDGALPARRARAHGDRGPGDPARLDGEGVIKVTASFGVAALPEHGERQGGAHRRRRRGPVPGQARGQEPHRAGRARGEEAARAIE